MDSGSSTLPYTTILLQIEKEVPHQHLVSRVHLQQQAMIHGVDIRRLCTALDPHTLYTCITYVVYIYLYIDSNPQIPILYIAIGVLDFPISTTENRTTLIIKYANVALQYIYVYILCLYIMSYCIAYRRTTVRHTVYVGTFPSTAAIVYVNVRYYNIIVQQCSATVMSSGHDDAETWPYCTVRAHTHTHTHTHLFILTYTYIIYLHIYIYMHNMISTASRAR